MILGSINLNNRKYLATKESIHSLITLALKINEITKENDESYFIQEAIKILHNLALFTKVRFYMPGISNSEAQERKKFACYGGYLALYYLSKMVNIPKVKEFIEPLTLKEMKPLHLNLLLNSLKQLLTNPVNKHEFPEYLFYELDRLLLSKIRVEEMINELEEDIRKKQEEIGRENEEKEKLMKEQKEDEKRQKYEKAQAKKERSEQAFKEYIKKVAQRDREKSEFKKREQQQLELLLIEERQKRMSIIEALKKKQVLRKNKAIKKKTEMNKRKGLYNKKKETNSIEWRLKELEYERSLKNLNFVSYV